MLLMTHDPRRLNISRKNGNMKDEASKRQRIHHEYLYNNGASSYPIIEYTLSTNEQQGDERTYSLPVPSFIMDDTFPRVVAFYDPDQDTSLTFQSTFIQLARKIRHDSQNIPVLFHAINCVLHFEVCANADFHLRVFPSLWVFTEGGVSGGQKIDALVEYEELLSQVANVVGVTIKARKKLGSTNDDFSADSNDIRTHQTDEGKAYDKGLHNLDSGKSSRSLVANDIGTTNIQDEDITETPHYSSDQENNNKQGDGGTTTHKKGDQNLERIYRDAQKSFSLTLKHNIYPPDGKDTPLYLPPKQKDILFDFLDLLHWTLPSSWIIHDVINDLRNDFATVIKGRQSLLSILNRHDTVHGDWSDECRHDDNLNMEDERNSVGFVGYSCGLWNLLHISSVGVAESHKLVMGDRERVTPSYAAWVIRDFVDHFVVDPRENGIESVSSVNQKMKGNIPWCLNCKSNLLKSYETCMYGLCSLDFEATNFDTNTQSHTWNVLAEWIWYTKENVYVSSFDGVATNIPMDQIYGHLHRLFWPLGPQNPRIPVLKKMLRSGRRSRREEHKIFYQHGYFISLGLLVSLISLYHYCKLDKKMKRIQKLGKSV